MSATEGRWFADGRAPPFLSVTAQQCVGDIHELLDEHDRRMADHTSQQATAVATAAEQASANVQTVASAAEKLSGSIQEIARQVAQSTTITASAVTQADTTRDTAGGLVEAAERISEVASTIAAAVNEQGAATQEIARSVEQASSGTAEVSANITQVTSGAAKTGQAAGTQLELAGDIRARIQGMRDRLLEIMEESGDKNLSERHTVNVAPTIVIDDNRKTCLLQDVSRGGAAILDRAVEIEASSEFQLDVPGLGLLNA